MKRALFAIIAMMSTHAWAQVTPPAGRLTLYPGVAEMRTDFVGANKLYYAPSVGGTAPINNGVSMSAMPFISPATDTVGLTLTLNPTNFPSSTIFDGYLTLDAGNVVLCGVPWASSAVGRSSRAIALGMFNGIIVNAAAANCFGSTTTIAMPQYQGTYVGKFLTSTAGTIDFKFGNAGAGGGAALVSISNAYNRVPGAFVVQDTNSNWAPQTTPNISSNISGWEPLDLVCTGCSGGQHNTVTMITEGNKVDVSLNMGVYPSVGANLYVGVGLDYATAAVVGIWSKCAVGVGGPTGTSSVFHEAQARCAGYPTEGLHILQAMELGTSGPASGQMYSDQGGVTQVGGLIATWDW